MMNVYRTCQSLFAGLVTVSICVNACQGQIPIVENNRAPVVQVAPVVKATGTPVDRSADAVVTSQPIPVIKKTSQDQPFGQLAMLQPLPASALTPLPPRPVENPTTLIPVIQNTSGANGSNPQSIPVVSGKSQEFERTPGSMVQASSMLPPKMERTPVTPPKMGLPSQPVFDGSWTPVPPEPVSNSSFRVQPAGPSNTVSPGKYLDDFPAVDGPVELESGLTSSSSCDCGSNSCSECAGIGVSAFSRPVLRHHNVVGGNGIVSRVRGRFGGILGGGTRYGMCGFCPDASRYLIVDGMYWSRTDGQITGNNFGGVGGSDVWDNGIRFTIGGRRDAVSGVEATFMSLFPVTDSLTSTSAGGNINARFVPGGGFNAVQTGSFYNATQTYQESSTQVHSVELNRVRYSWDVARTHLGMRYIWFEDDYLYNSTSGAGTGAYSQNANNHMFGPEAGVDLFYDVGRRISLSGFGKLGGYLNFTQTDTSLVNNAVTYINNRNTDTDLSASADLGINALMHISRNARLRVGYNAMWLWGVTSTVDNYPATMTPTTGQFLDTSGDAFLHGANFGIEIYR